jgi:hypothetical protein
MLSKMLFLSVGFGNVTLESIGKERSMTSPDNVSSLSIVILEVKLILDARLFKRFDVL